jgi:hypothetical protein
MEKTQLDVPIVPAVGDTCSTMKEVDSGSGKRVD